MYYGLFVVMVFMHLHMAVPDTFDALAHGRSRHSFLFDLSAYCFSFFILCIYGGFIFMLIFSKYNCAID